MDVTRVDVVEFHVEAGAPRLVRGLLRTPQLCGEYGVGAHEVDFVVAQHHVRVCRAERVVALDIDSHSARHVGSSSNGRCQRIVVGDRSDEPARPSRSPS